MLKYIFLAILSGAVLLRAQTETDVILDLLQGLTDADPAGIRYLMDIFPRGEIDFSSFKETDLDKLFFLSPDSRAVLWRNRERINTPDDIEQLPVREAEKTLLRLCARTEKAPVALKAYSTAKTFEENSTRPGSPFFSKLSLNQKIYLSTANWTGGISFQKDRGETALIDSYNGYAVYNRPGFLAGIGSHYISFGEGITASRPVFVNYKTPTGISRSPAIRPYYGSDEIYPLKGLFFAYRYKNTAFSVSQSLRRYDASEDDGIFTIRTSGYHRTEAELSARERLEGKITIFSAVYNNDLFSAGIITAYTRFLREYRFEGVLFPASAFYTSAHFRAGRQKGVATEISLYPEIAFVFRGFYMISGLRADLRIFRYGQNPSFLGRHVIFNTLPAKSRGVNIRFEAKTGKAGRTGGYILFEQKPQNDEERLYGGIFWKHSGSLVTVSFRQKSNGMFETESRFGLRYRLEVKQNMSRFVLTTGIYARGISERITGRYLSLRYRLLAGRKFSIIANAIAWEARDGERIRLYTDGLPESFELLNAGDVGTYWSLQARYQLPGFQLFYLFGKQHFLPSEEGDIPERYRTLHQAGLRITY